MRRIAAAVVVLVGLAGCVTPSIPIPPPDPQQMMFARDPTAMTATFSYPPDQRYVDSTVFVFNQSQGTGVIAVAHADGSFGPTLAFPIAINNQVIVTIQREDQSESTCVTVGDGGKASPCF